jgi:type IV pilus assembly protein PilW
MNASKRMPQKYRERGVSLIELMVAMVIALLIAAAVGSLYIGSKESSRLQDGVNSARESGHAITELISREVRKAGNYGCFTWKTGTESAPLMVGAKLPTASGGYYPIPVTGAGASQTPNIGPDFDVRGGDVSGLTLPTGSTLTVVAGSDYVQTNYGQPVAYVTEDLANAAGEPDASAPIKLGQSVKVLSGQPFLVADCNSMLLLRADDGGSTGAVVTTLNHDPGSGDNVVPADTAFGGAQITKGAVLMKLASSTMFLATSADGRTGLYLWDTTVRDAAGDLQPFAQDVIKMRVLFGVDNGGTTLWLDGAAVTAAARWKEVLATQLHFVVASSEATGGVSPKEVVWNTTRRAYEQGTAAAPGNKVQQAYVVTTTIRGRATVF